MLLPEPETAKMEEQLLEHGLKTIARHLDIAILIADSLGKISLRDKLEHLKLDVDQLKP